MYSIEKILKNLEMKYRQLDKKVFSKETEGSLIILKSGGRLSYYVQKYNPELREYERKYLKKSEFEKAKNLAQSMYDNKLKSLLKRRIVQLKQINKDFALDEVDKLYDDLTEQRKKLIKPVETTRGQLIDDWNKKNYEGLTYRENLSEIYSKKGEMVRSKSEKILADKFYDMGIEYKYECPLILKNGKKIYPDFTFLNPTSLEQIYWEHFGMMDDKTYAYSTLKKIELYHKNDIILGDRLIATFEYSNNNVNFDMADKLIEKFLVKRL